MKWTWRIQLVWAGLLMACITLTARFSLDSGSVSKPMRVGNAASQQPVTWDSSTAKFPQAVRLAFPSSSNGQQSVPRVIELCQFCAPQPRSLYGVDCQSWRDPCHEPGWDAAHLLPFETYAHGEYVGPARSPHVQTYHIRVNDQIDFVYRFTHEAIPEAYRLMVGDEIMVETYPQEPDSIRRGDLATNRGLKVQPDGSIFLPYAGRISVANRTIDEVRADIEQRLTDPTTGGQFIRGTVQVVVTPLTTNSSLESLRSAVDARFGTGGQTRTATVTPEGTVQLVSIGSIPAQGMTIEELEAEVNARYVDKFGRGVQVSTILRQFAPRFVWVAGEVAQPGQYQVNQPVTVVQAIALARGFNNGGNVREIVVFRRDDNWQLMATRLDVRGVFVGKTPFPSDDIWLRDNDVVVVPKGPILRFDDFANLVFTRGLFAAFPYETAIGVNF